LKTVHKIIHGDSRQMNRLADRSVHLAITSPPYWQLKDYGTDNQIGYCIPAADFASISETSLPVQSIMGGIK